MNIKNYSFTYLLVTEWYIYQLRQYEMSKTSALFDVLLF